MEKKKKKSDWPIELSPTTVGGLFLMLSSISSDELLCSNAFECTKMFSIKESYKVHVYVYL